MALVRFDPFAELAAIQRELMRPSSETFSPAADIHQTDEAYVLHLDVPGVPEDAITVTAEDGRLTVVAERADVVKADQATWVRRERRTGQSVRTFTLPEGVDADLITASLDHGVLELRVPRAAERQPRQIPVTATA